MNPLFTAALDIQQFCRAHDWNFCVIGGLAAGHWGRPRVTQDVDLSLLTGFDHEERFVDALLSRYRGRRSDARAFALGARVLLLEATNGVFVDVGLAGLPFEERMIRRATPASFAPNVELVIASPEDVVITKAFAGRHVDWFDVEGILANQRGKLDWGYILGELPPLCDLKESPEIVDELLAMRAKIDAE
jgi:hypothetical protein